VGAIVAAYAAFLDGTSLWLISSARGATAAILVLGFVGGCALSTVGAVHAEARPRSARAFEAIANTFGAVALAAAVIGVITGSTVALAVLVSVAIALWLTATIRHAFTIPGGPGTGHDGHEVIQLEEAAHR
jgi:hypothetical protein